MPVRAISGTDLSYALVIFDDNGKERPEPDGTLLSETLIKRVADPARPVSDVIFTSHGWQGDVPAAIAQYDRWIGATAAQAADHRRSRAAPGRLRAADHRPALAEQALRRRGPSGRRPGRALGEAAAALRPTATSTPGPSESPTRRGRAPRSGRSCNRRRTRPTPRAPSKALLDAYAALFAESGLATKGSAAAPGADQDSFDPKTIIAQSNAGAARPATQLLGIGDKLERPVPFAAAPALVLEDEGPGARVRRERRPRAAGEPAEARRRRRAST